MMNGLTAGYAQQYFADGVKLPDIAIFVKEDFVRENIAALLDKSEHALYVAQEKRIENNILIE